MDVCEPVIITIDISFQVNNSCNVYWESNVKAAGYRSGKG